MSAEDLTCGTCTYSHYYHLGSFSKIPHYCCEMIWELDHEDYRVDPNRQDENCPLLNESLKDKIEEINNRRDWNDLSYFAG